MRTKIKELIEALEDEKKSFSANIDRFKKLADQCARREKLWFLFGRQSYWSFIRVTILAHIEEMENSIRDIDNRIKDIKTWQEL